MKCRFIPFRPLEISRFDYERQKCQKMRFASSQSRVTLCKMIKYIKKYQSGNTYAENFFYKKYNLHSFLIRESCKIFIYDMITSFS